MSPVLHCLAFALVLVAAGCDSGFDPPPVGTSTVTVVGDTEVAFSGEGFYSRISDQPSTWEILLTDRNTPTVRFRIVTDVVGTGTYALPADANARLELPDDDATTYRATEGSLVVTDATATRAQGRFAFTAERLSGRRVTVSGTFTAE